MSMINYLRWRVVIVFTWDAYVIKIGLCFWPLGLGNFIDRSESCPFSSPSSEIGEGYSRWSVFQQDRLLSAFLTAHLTGAWARQTAYSPHTAPAIVCAPYLLTGHHTLGVVRVKRKTPAGVDSRRIIGADRWWWWWWGWCICSQTPNDKLRQRVVWGGVEAVFFCYFFTFCNGGCLARDAESRLRAESPASKALLSSSGILQHCTMALDVQTFVVFIVIAVLVLVNVLLMFILGTRWWIRVRGPLRLCVGYASVKEDWRESERAFIESGDTQHSNMATHWNEWRWYNICIYLSPDFSVMSCPLTVCCSCWWCFGGR